MIANDGMKKLALLLVECGFVAQRAWLKRNFTTRQSENTRQEETMDFFTNLDAELDERLIEGIATRFGIERFLTEEGARIPERNFSGRDVQPARRAVIDSLDGTSNFATGRPDFGISVAIEGGGVPTLAGIITPVRGELLVAGAGEGTFLFSLFGKTERESVEMMRHGEAQRISPENNFALKNKKCGRSSLETSRVYVHTGKRRNFELSPQDPWNTIYAKLANPGCTFCCTVALVEVALGKLDGAVIGFQNHWDYAAGKLLVQEAGGYFQNWDREWTHTLSRHELSEAHATKDEHGDEWLSHVVAAGSEELFSALLKHFTG